MTSLKKQIPDMIIRNYINLLKYTAYKYNKSFNLSSLAEQICNFYFYL